MGRHQLPRSINALHGSREASALEPLDAQTAEQAEAAAQVNGGLLQDAQRLLAELQAELARDGLMINTGRGRRRINPVLKAVQSQTRIVANLMKIPHVAPQTTPSAPLIDEHGCEYHLTGSDALDDYLREGRRLEAEGRRQREEERAAEEAKREARRARRQLRASGDP
jgi:hypothetical protein